MVTRRYLLGGEYPSEEFVQASLEKYFFRQGFDIDTGSYIDLICRDKESRDVVWHIEVKGKTSQPGLDFRTCLGQLVQRMTKDNINYAIAVPRIKQYERLIEETSILAVSKLNLHWIFVGPDGSVTIKEPDSSTMKNGNGNGNGNGREVSLVNGGVKRFITGDFMPTCSYGKAPVVFKSSRREMWDWLDDFVISNGVIPSIADIKKEAESRSGKWTLSNVKIEYQFWKIYHLYKGHFFYQSE